MIMNKLLLFSVFSILTLNVMAQEKIVQTAGRDQLGTCGDPQRAGTGAGDGR